VPASIPESTESVDSDSARARITLNRVCVEGVLCTEMHRDAWQDIKNVFIKISINYRPVCWMNVEGKVLRYCTVFFESEKYGLVCYISFCMKHVRMAYSLRI
jgi:hypothetical protein